MENKETFTESDLDENDVYKKHKNDHVVYKKFLKTVYGKFAGYVIMLSPFYTDFNIQIFNSQGSKILSCELGSPETKRLIEKILNWHCGLGDQTYTYIGKYSVSQISIRDYVYGCEFYINYDFISMNIKEFKKFRKCLNKIYKKFF